MNSRRFALVLCVWITCGTLYSQNIPPVEFADYLLRNDLYQEGLALTTEWPEQNLVGRDTMVFWRAKYYQYRDQWSSAIEHFAEVPESSAYYVESYFNGNYLRIRNGELDQTEQALSGWSFREPGWEGLAKFQLAGTYLLSRKLSTFDSLAANFGEPSYYYAAEREDLLKYAQDIRDFNYKSPWLSGLMSFVIPGSGKMYSGKVGQGITNFFQVAFMGALAYEGYRNDGINSFRFIFFSSVAGLFHVSQSIGSIYVAKKHNEEFDQALDARIRVDLYVPLRTKFGR